MQWYVSGAALAPILPLPPPKPYTQLSIGGPKRGGGVLKGHPDYVIFGVNKEGQNGEILKGEVAKGETVKGEIATPLFPIEVMQKWNLPVGEGQSLFGLYSDEATRGLVSGALVQSYGYIRDNGFKYGVLTNGEVFCFLKCEENGDLLIAEVRNPVRNYKGIGFVFVSWILLFAKICLRELGFGFSLRFRPSEFKS